MIRRISSLFEVYATDKFAVDHQALFPIAQTITIHSQSIYWHDNTRYSQRQQMKLQLGGLMGNVVFQGNILPFLPLLEITTDYAQLFAKFVQVVNAIPLDFGTVHYIASLTSILEEYTWCIPSSTEKTLSDISLYDHSVTTAAIAQALWKYVKTYNITNKEDLNKA